MTEAVALMIGFGPLVVFVVAAIGIGIALWRDEK